MSLPNTIETKANEQLTEAEKESRIKKEHNFYSVTCDKDGQIKPLRIKKAKIVDKLLEKNFYRYDIDENNYLFVSINDNRIKEVSIEYITDEFFNYIKKLEPCTHKIHIEPKNGDDYEIPVTITKAMIREALIENVGEYFSKKVFARMQYPNELTIKKDEKNKMFIYYANGYVEITPTVYTLKDYTTLNELIWESQVIDREFKVNKGKGMYEKFIERVAGYKDKTSKEPISERIKQRIESIRTIMGYSMHDFFDYKLKCPINTDEKMSNAGEPNGRTGKTVFTKALQRMKNRNVNSTNAIEINGKDFLDNGKHKYEECSLSTTLTIINDVPKNYDIEIMFNDITEGIKINKKNQQPFKQYSKIILNTNKTIRINGESAKDRVVFFEFSDYFNKNHSPLDEFGTWFFTEWNEEEWNRFDTFMIESCQLFLQKGLIEAEYINLNRREVMEHTSPEFVDFMTDFIETGHTGVIEIVNFKYDEKINKQSLFTAFIQSYSDFSNGKFKQRTFTTWLQKYTQNNAELQPITKANNTEGRSNGIDWIVFKKK